MANLDLIRQFNATYGKNSPVMRETKLFAINEALDPDNLQKAISNSISDLGPEYVRYFYLGLPADVAMLFIDVCGFSTKQSSLNGNEIGEFFDEYYDIIIPIIYKYGGEVDKIMGDGIICLFGPPFQDLTLKKNISQANLSAKEIIKATRDTKFASKVAMHAGSINYFKNKSGLYKEFTIIGKPLTELFRLESISKDDRINYFGGSEVRKYYSGLISHSSGLGQASWTHSQHLVNNLKGVDYEQYYSIKYNI